MHEKGLETMDNIVMASSRNNVCNKKFCNDTKFELEVSTFHLLSCSNSSPFIVLEQQKSENFAINIHLSLEEKIKFAVGV